MKLKANECVYFYKTKEKYGELSNMCSGFPLSVNGLKILTSEALYQSLKYPNNPEIQLNIIKQKSPMAAKMVQKPCKEFIRSDWDEVKVKVMHYCLQLKLFQNYDKFKIILESTKNMPIVEKSKKDAFWGAIENNGYFEGNNILGKLLVKLRDEYIHDKKIMYSVLPLQIKDFKLNGFDINEILD